MASREDNADKQEVKERSEMRAGWHFKTALILLINAVLQWRVVNVNFSFTVPEIAIVTQ